MTSIRSGMFTEGGFDSWVERKNSPELKKKKHQL